MMSSFKMPYHLVKYICIVLLSIVLAACSTDSAPVQEPVLQTEAVTDRAEMMRRAAEWIDKVDFRDPNRLAQPWGYRQDCSGFISYIWGIGKAGNSGTQPNTTLFAPGKGYGYEISRNDLQFGDVLNKPRIGSSYNGHIVMFGGWVDKSKGTFWRYHVTGPAGRRGPNYGARKGIKNLSDYPASDRYVAVRSNALRGQPTPPSTASIYDARVFDWQYYLNKYPDLRANGVRTLTQARAHWRSYGIREGRQATPMFSSRSYLARYYDLRKAFPGSDKYKKAVEHYLEYGLREGRTGTNIYIYHGHVFDWRYYLNTYPDLRRAGLKTATQARVHWRDFGIREGRRGSANFYSRIYYSRYADLQRAFPPGKYQYYGLIEHYLVHGIKEGRSGR